MYTILLFIITIIAIIVSGLMSKNCSSQDTIAACLSRSYTNILRGLAMVMIIFGHVAGTYHEGVWFSPFASTGVALFLLLSGYGNCESFKRNRIFKFQKLFKIAFPYWIIVIFLFIIKYDDYDFNTLLLSLLFVKPLISGYWFVNYIFLCYLIFWFSMNMVYEYRWLVFILFAIISFVCLQPLESEQSLSFIAGILISERKESLFMIKKGKLLEIAVCLFIFGIAILGLKQLTVVRNNDMLFSFVQLLYKLPLALSIVFSFSFCSIFKDNRLLVSIAPYTYELYLVHMPLLRYININSPVFALFSSVLFVLAISNVSILFQLFNKKIMKWINI